MQLIRVYPLCCQSAQCGRLNCDGCRNLPVLTEFKQWVKDTEAKQEDPVWGPSIWTATKKPV